MAAYSSHPRFVAVFLFCSMLLLTTGLSLAGTAQLNLNKATAAQLEALPGIGPELAERILEYKKTNGKFTSVEELANIKGIGKKTLAKFKDTITVKKTTKKTP